MYQTIFLGLINFFELDGESGRVLLIPDGRSRTTKRRIDPKGKITPHHASILVRREDVESEAGWPADARDSVIEGEKVATYRISKPSLVRISGMDTSGTFDPSEFDARNIKLRDIVPDIDIDRKDASTIAQIEIRRGKLSSARLQNALVAHLTIDDHTGNVTITAEPDDGSSVKKLVLKDNSTIVVANMSSHLGGDATNDPERSHFRLYAQLDRGRRATKFKDPALSQINLTGAPEIQSTHPFIEFLRTTTLEASPEAQCTVTGCCEPAECARRTRRTE